MKNLKLAPLAIILLVALLYAGFKGYVYFQVSSELDRMITMARPFADISYGGISSGLDGSLEIENIRVLPQGGAEDARIDSIGMRGDGPMFLLQVVSGMKQGKPPERLSLSVRGLQVALNGEYAAQYSGLLQGFQKNASKQLDSCSFGGWVSPQAFKAVGMDQFIVDMDMGYSYQEAAGRLEASMEFGARDVETTQLDVALEGASQLGAVMMGVMPRFEHVAIRYELDPEYAARVLGHCAQQRGQTREAYVDSLFGGDREQLAQALGMLPGPGISEALRTFLKQPDGIDISLRPPADLDVTTLHLYEPQDVALMLNTNLSVNGSRVNDLSFEALPASTLFSQLPGFGASAEGEQALAQEQEAAAKPRPRIRIAYLETVVDELPNYVGRDVRIYMYKPDVVRTGELFAIEDGEATVIQRLHGGKMAVHVPLSEIRMAEVLRVVE
jgi:hypothetical protein